MEIALQLRCYSFYTSSQTIYIQGTVLLKKKLTPPPTKEHYFENITTGSKLNLKYECSDPEKVKLLLTERVVRITSQDIFIPTDQSKGFSYIVQGLEKCEI